jgi:hypothetical protein
MPIKRLVTIFSLLFASILIAHGLSRLILESFHKDVYFVLTSVVLTMLSAIIVIVLRRKAIIVSGSKRVDIESSPGTTLLP